MVHSTARNSSNNLPSYPPDNHHSLDRRPCSDSDRLRRLINCRIIIIIIIIIVVVVVVVV